MSWSGSDTAENSACSRCCAAPERQIGVLVPGSLETQVSAFEENMMQTKQVQGDKQRQEGKLNPQQAASRLQQLIRCHFAEKDSAHQEHIDLKLEHSLRVWELVRRIALEERIGSAASRLAEIGAIYHDIGRFPQYAKYRTFKDSLSENHGRLGLRTLRRTNLLAGLSSYEARTILRCVFMHNRAALPVGLPYPLRIVLMLVRDGDKLDILRVISAHLLDQGGGDEVLTLGLIEDPLRYSPQVMGQLKDEGMVKYEDMVWINDFKLLLCSWIFGLNFPASRRTMDRQGYIWRLVDSLPITEETKTLKRRMLTSVNDHV